jgi:hypothetical protein
MTGKTSKVSVREIRTSHDQSREDIMNRRSIISASLIAAIALALPVAAHAQTVNDLVGTWQSVANVNTAADGTKQAAWGPHGIGLAIFESNGYFMMINVNPDVPKPASHNRLQQTADELSAIVGGSIAKFGTYSVADKVITLKVQGSSDPNVTGTVEKRPIVSLSAEELTFISLPASGGQSVVSWKRVK